MFMPEKEVPNLELCKHLKELGYPQDGKGWYWAKKWRYFHGNIKSYPPSYDEKVILDTAIWLLEFLQNEPSYSDYVRAPTCRELGEWLPAKIETKGFDFYLIITRTTSWEIYYAFDMVNSQTILAGSMQEDDVEPNARAKMLIWLAEKGYISLGE